MSKRIKVGVVGHGYFGAFHAKHYAAAPDVELVAIVDPRDLDLGKERFHLRDHRELIGKVDAVSIAAPTARHHPIAADLIGAGIHVLVEKPLAPNAAEARDLTARAERAGVVLHVGHIERFSPAYGALRALVARPLLIECRRHTAWTGRALDVDVVLDLMIHDIDLALDLAGAPPTAVEASGIEVMGHGLDAVIARVTFGSGAVAHLSASRISPVAGRSLAVHEAGQVVVADLGGRAVSVLDAATRTVRQLDVPAVDALGLEIRTFLDAVAGRGGKGVGGEAAAAAVSLADWIRDAAR